MRHSFYTLLVFGSWFFPYDGEVYASTRQEVVIHLSVEIKKESLLPSLEINWENIPVVAEYNAREQRFEDVVIPFYVSSSGGYGISYVLSVDELGTTCMRDSGGAVFSETTARLNGVPVDVGGGFVYTRVNVEHQLSLSVRVVNELFSPVNCEGFAVVTARLQI
ncbi:hypothetical protein ACEUAY_11650 [Aeromonas veronii]